MAGNRTRALALMERLRGLEIEEQAQELGVLRSTMERMRRDREILSTRLREEVHVDTMEAAPYVGRFIEAIRSELAYIDEQMEVIKPRLSELEDKLRVLFQDQKVYETLRLTRLREAKREAERREEAELEELTLLRWNR
jgi:flagellar biosynthesis chaperone FliJ